MVSSGDMDKEVRRVTKTGGRLSIFEQTLHQRYTSHHTTISTSSFHPPKHLSDGHRRMEWISLSTCWRTEQTASHIHHWIWPIPLPRVTPKGYLASGDGYTHRYDKIIANVPRKTKCVDDTALWDEQLSDHWWRIIDYLELMGKEGIVLNPSKFQFSKKDVNFAEFRITDHEVKPLDKYLESIKQFPTPRNIAGVRSWFGLVNQVSHYG